MENENNEKVIIKEEREKKKRKINIKLPGPITLLIYIAIISVLLGGSLFGIKRIFESQQKVLNLGLENVNELVTQTCHTIVLEDSKESKYFFDLFEIPFTESRQIFSYDFDVDVSINFSKVEIESIDDKKEEIKIKMPHSKIYKIVVLPETFKSYLDTDGLFSRIDLTEHNEALNKMEELAKEQCLKSNLLESADENAERLLEAMIKSEKKYKNYNIVYNYFNEGTEESSK